MSEITYLRHKISSSDKIVWDGKAFSVSRTFKTQNYDHILGKWVKGKVETKLLPLSEIGLHKELNQVVYIHRQNVNPITLLPMELYLKRVRHVEVKDKESNIFINLVHGRVFATDLVHTVPVPMNVEPPFAVPEYLTIKTVSEEPCTPNETSWLLNELENPKCIFKPLIFEQNIDPKGKSTFKQMVGDIKS